VERNIRIHIKKVRSELKRVVCEDTKHSLRQELKELKKQLAKAS